MPFLFENLQVYQKAVDLADRASSLAEGFPRGYYFLADQLNRAALSVATNLAEGQRPIHQGRPPQLFHDCPRLGPGMRSSSRDCPAAWFC